MSTALREQRAARLRAAMDQAGIDLLILAGNAWRSDYLRYALDVTPMEGLALAFISPSGTRLLVESPAEAERILREQPQLDVAWSSDLLRAAEAVIAKQGARAALAPTHALPWRLGNGPLGATAKAATAMLDRLMVRKSKEEADAVEHAVSLADAGYDVFRNAARVGRPEFELVAETEAWLRAQGCPENFMILGAGGQEFRGMRPPTERPLRLGDLVTTELTPCVDGYYAQICRTLVLGPASQAQRNAFAVYQEALAAGIAAVKPGNTHGDVARAQNDVFRREGLAEYISSEYTRVRGHGVGLFVDGPHVLEDVDLVLEPDMTLIVHPNTYHPVAGYIVLGDTVRVTADGCKVLTRTPRELFEVSGGA
jgi:Xaa-Pro aminopeptidase